MKKALIISMLFVTTACNTSAPLQNPQEIMTKAVQQMQNLTAVHTAFNGVINTQKQQGSQSIHFKGEGDSVIDIKQHRLQVDFKTKSTSGTIVSSDIIGTIDVFADSSAFFYKTSNLTSPALGITLTEGNEPWVKSPSVQGVINSATYINPNLYTVTALNGVVPLNNKDHYHINAVLNKNQLPELKELADTNLAVQFWIDTDTFNVSKISWNIETTEPTNSVSLQIDLSNHNKVSPTNPPKDYIDSTSSVEQPPINPDAFIEELLNGG